jgi:hypothetical protein
VDDLFRQNPSLLDRQRAELPNLNPPDRAADMDLRDEDLLTAGKYANPKPGRRATPDKVVLAPRRLVGLLNDALRKILDPHAILLATKWNRSGITWGLADEFSSMRDDAKKTGLRLRFV